MTARDEHAEHVGAGVVQPSFTGLVEQGERRQPAHPFVGLRRPLRFRRTRAQTERVHRLEERLRPRRAEVRAESEAEGEEVSHRDRSLRRHRVAVDRPAGVDEHAPIGELGQ